ncbi:MAG: ribosome hibernation-promoting factor, HPF/YfiA family [Bacillota bacterium]
MKVLVKGKNFEIGEPLREYAEKKVAKIGKFLTAQPMLAQVTVAFERGLYIVDVTVQVKELLVRGEEKTNDVYASIDGAVDKIERQIQKFKTKIHRRLHPEEHQAEATANAPTGEAEEPRIVRTKRFAIKPMSVDEAVMQMDLLGHDFYVFSNAETEEVNVVYRRKDGNYGLFELEF